MRRPFAVVLLLTVLVLVMGILSLNDGLLYTPDSARYLIWARSLAHLDGFRDDTVPEPTRYVVHAPLYSVLLAPAALVAPASVPAAKVLTLLGGAGLLWLFFRWTSKSVGDGIAAGATVVLALHGLFVLYSTQVLSEIPFALAFVGALFVAETAEDGSEQRGPAAQAGLVLLLGAAMFLREVGVSVIGGLVLFWLLRGRWRTALWVGGLCALLYALWFVRNEVVVAGLEDPPLRNSRLFVSHLYTPKTATLAAEFAARVVTNASVYIGHLGTLVFAPDFSRTNHVLVSLDDPMIAAVWAAKSYLVPVFLVVSLGLGLAGIVGTWRERIATRMTLIVLGCYALPILIYPINDVRFLFPVVLLWLHWGALGIHVLRKRWPSAVGSLALRWTAAAVALACVFPSIAWGSSYVRNNWRLAHDASRFARELATNERLPEYYSKLLPEAGRWIAAQPDGDGTVICRWKELALWLDRAKVIDVDPQMTPDTFDRLIRDYDVKYVASIVWRVGLRENELQIAYSSRFDFEPVFRAGNIEVLRVNPRRPSQSAPYTVSSDADSLTVFRGALRLLRRGDPMLAESLLVRSEQRFGNYATVVYHRAVAKALAGRYDDALALFDRFRSMPQAGSFLQLAWYHQEIIARIRAAQAATEPEERATRFHVAAVNEWELGYRGATYRLLDSAIAAQPQFFPAWIFKAIFKMQDGDIAGSASALRMAATLRPDNLLVTNLSQALAGASALPGMTDTARVVGTLRSIGAAFLAMDLREDAIDVWRTMLRWSPRNVEALASLADAYARKGRYAPARRFARLWLAADPGNAEALQLASSLEQRWQ